ncbi:MAG: ATP-dependent Clp protease proteolytic subunit [Verrucomicrobia bacterium]|nr:ATP-dependent Clp protease proteolytic subunit [Verrucomicrobiota bacterium]
MRTLLTFLIGLLPLLATAGEAVRAADAKTAGKVFILPIREQIDEPLVFLVRRGVKAAMDAKADALIVDMDTPGGSVTSMMEIIKILDQFTNSTATYVNTKAFSAGALISFATQKIYMAPGAVIGAAAVVTASAEGGTQALPDTVEVKHASAVSALMRVNAEKNGHNVELVDAMMKKTRRLEMDGKVLNREGELLTLTAKEATTKYGNPPKPLLAVGIPEDLDKVVEALGHAGAKITRIEPTGAETVAFWVTKIAPLLLLIGIAGIYIEFKTPGFGVPGVVGVIAFAIYFLGGYIAGLSGIEWVALFVIGLVLLILELFVFPGHAIFGIAGAGLIVVSIVMAMVDVYPGMPTLPQITLPESNLAGAVGGLVLGAAGALAVAALLARFLPKTQLYGAMVSTSASGVTSVVTQGQRQASRVGQMGVTLSVLRPGGKAQFGEDILDVMTQGELIEKGMPVRIIRHSGTEAVVELVNEPA